MSTFNWESFLRQWSQSLASVTHEQKKRQPFHLGHLSYSGAIEEQILHAETRLNIALPPSYREFLTVTNGWYQNTPFVNKFWSTQDIEWFPVRHEIWIDQITERYRKQVCTNVDNLVNSSVNGSGHCSNISSISDEEYFVYGDAQDCSKIRAEYLKTALEISEKSNSTIYLLNPQVISADGEWEAWFLGDWLPGADRYQSFREMMQAEYRNFLEQQDV
ncbi:MAG: SMI1/KNR4 family protein [Leptolyngbyaceae cyanobacterium CRU_2_3]|nr:SMI1/KNR4 family protein [Leptolyngbyaceae cyanobacterium CRU_2_3]